jgi:hypothetical protein
MTAMDATDLRVYRRSQMLSYLVVCLSRTRRSGECRDERDRSRMRRRGGARLLGRFLRKRDGDVLARTASEGKFRSQFLSQLIRCSSVRIRYAGRVRHIVVGSLWRFPMQ